MARKGKGAASGQAKRWYDYSRAREVMFKVTDVDYARWNIVRSGRQKARTPQLHLPIA
jgi:polyphosphate kinase 2 (PPK2 family)